MNLLAKEKGKGKIDLSPRIKPKKQDKYSEKSKVKREYKFSLNDQTIYCGLIEEYRNTLCTIIKRSRNHLTEYYTIKFAIDDEIVENISGGVLQTVEEFESNLEKQRQEELDTINQEDNDSENNSNKMSEVERKIRESGLIPLFNPTTCMNPIAYVEMRCHDCHFEPRCIYYKKYKYKKIQ